MPQPFLAVTLTAWSGGLSVMPLLALYLEESPTIDCEGGESGLQAGGGAWALSRRGTNNAPRGWPRVSSHP